MSGAADGFLLRDLINKEKISLKREAQLFPKKKSKYWWCTFQGFEVEGHSLSPARSTFPSALVLDLGVKQTFHCSVKSYGGFW